MRISDWSSDVCSSDLHVALERFRFDRNGFTALNLAMADIAVIKIGKETFVDEPIHLDIAAEDGTAIFPHVVVIAEAGCKATIVEKLGRASCRERVCQYV